MRELLKFFSKTYMSSDGFWEAFFSFLNLKDLYYLKNNFSYQKALSRLQGLQ